MKTIILFICITTILSHKTNQHGMMNMNMNDMMDMMSIPSFWCWYPCYCWKPNIFTSFTSPPLCWCWFPCGCLNMGFMRGRGASLDASYTINAEGGNRTATAPAPTSPPSGEPNL